MDVAEEPKRHQKARRSRSESFPRGPKRQDTMEFSQVGLDSLTATEEQSLPVSAPLSERKSRKTTKTLSPTSRRKRASSVGAPDDKKATGLAVGVADPYERVTADISGSLNVELHAVHGFPDGFIYVRLSFDDMPPTFMHPATGQWNSSPIRGTDPIWKRGVGLHTLFHTWIFKVPLVVKVEIIEWEDGNTLLAEEAAGKKKFTPVEWEIDVNTNKDQDRVAGSFVLQFLKEENVSKNRVWCKAQTGTGEVCLSYSAQFLQNFNDKQIDDLQPNGSVLEPSIVCRREFPDAELSRLVYGDYGVRVQGELHDMFVLRMVKKQRWILPQKEWYKRKLLLWRFPVPTYNTTHPEDGLREQALVLKQNDVSGILNPNFKSIEQHRRFLRVKNLWTKIVSYFIERGYSLQPYLLLLKNSTARKKGDPHPNLIIVGAEKEKYYVDISGSIPEAMLEDLGKIENGPAFVKDFDGRHLSSYLRQRAYAESTYMGLSHGLRTREGATFMNKIVSVFAKYNYEIFNSSMGFFVVLGNEYNEKKESKCISFIPSIAYTNPKANQFFVKLEGDNLTEDQVEDLIDNKWVSAHHVGEQHDDSPVNYWHLALLHMSASKVEGVMRDEYNILMGMLDLLGQFIEHGYEIHSTGSPGDVILVKKHPKIKKMLKNAYWEFKPGGDLILLGPILKSDVSNMKRNIIIEVLSPRLDEEAAADLKNLGWKKTTMKHFERGYRWRFHLPDKKDGRKSTRAQQYFLTILNVLGKLGYRVVAPFWRDVISADRSSGLWKPGATVGSSAFVLLQRTPEPLKGCYTIVNADIDKNGFYLATRGLWDKQPWMRDLAKRSGVTNIEKRKQTPDSWDIRVSLGDSITLNKEEGFTFQARQHFRYKNESAQYMVQLVDLMARYGGCYLFRWGTFYDLLFFMPETDEDISSTISHVSEETSLDDSLASFF